MALVLTRRTMIYTLVYLLAVTRVNAGRGTRQRFDAGHSLLVRSAKLCSGIIRLGAILKPIFFLRG